MAKIIKLLGPYVLPFPTDEGVVKVPKTLPYVYSLVRDARERVTRGGGQAPLLPFYKGGMQVSF